MTRAPQPASMTLNLAPLVDVMMCLIIFFLIASRLVEEQRRPLELAVAASARSSDEPPAAPLVINVRPGRDAAEYVIYGWDGQRMAEQILPASDLDSLLTRRAVYARQTGDELSCVIRADQGVRYADVEAVLRACGRARIGRVTFAARPLDEGGRR